MAGAVSSTLADDRQRSASTHGPAHAVDRPDFTRLSDESGFQAFDIEQRSVFGGRRHVRSRSGFNVNARIDCVSQRVAGDVVYQHGDEDGNTRRKDHVRGDPQVNVGGLKQITPRRGRGLNTEAQAAPVEYSTPSQDSE